MDFWSLSPWHGGRKNEGADEADSSFSCILGIKYEPRFLPQPRAFTGHQFHPPQGTLRLPQTGIKIGDLL